MYLIRNFIHPDSYAENHRGFSTRLCVRVCVCLSVIETDHWSVCVDPSWQKDFGAKEVYNRGHGRRVNAQAFSSYRQAG